MINLFKDINIVNIFLINTIKIKKINTDTMATLNKYRGSIFLKGDNSEVKLTISSKVNKKT
jgi:hypothetical protein